MLAGCRQGRRPASHDDEGRLRPHVTNGILGNFTINSTGDTNLTPITIYKQAGKNLNPVKTLVPTASLIGG